MNLINFVVWLSTGAVIADPISGINFMSILIAFAGAILLILISRMIGGKGRYIRNK